jgi:hypothetical protein
LDRQLDTKLQPFGSPDYGKEELIAEMSAAFLCGESGIVPRVIENQAAYISGWLGKIKADKKLVISAAGAAARAAEWILGQRTQSVEEGQGGPGGASAIPAAASEPIAAKELSAPKYDRKTLLNFAAKTYIQRGFAVVPIPARQKGPVLENWQNLRLKEQDVERVFHGAGNIGIILGAPSGNLVDVDLDCPEARDLADRFLPETSAVTGRPGSPRSHWWYICPDLQTTRHRDPVTNASIVEVRGTGCQTLVGPSIHPSGELYEALEGKPTQVDAKTLCEAIERLATEVIRLRHSEIAAKTATPAAILSHSVSTSGDRTQVLRRASAYLGAMPPAISGQGGHNATYAASTALVHGFGLTDVEALELLKTQYNPKCQPPWTEKELQHKVSEAASQPHKRPQGWLLAPAQ